MVIFPSHMCATVIIVNYVMFHGRIKSKVRCALLHFDKLIPLILIIHVHVYMQNVKLNSFFFFFFFFASVFS